MRWSQPAWTRANPATLPKAYGDRVHAQARVEALEEALGEPARRLQGARRAVAQAEETLERAEANRGEVLRELVDTVTGGRQ